MEREVYPFWPVEFSTEEKEMVSYVVENELTMLSPERLFSIVLSCRWVVENGLEGDFVECGVWRGGASILIAFLLRHHGVNDRNLWLFDTFSGMTEPEKVDTRTRDGKSFSEIVLEHRGRGLVEDGMLALASLETVVDNFEKAGIDLANVRFVTGDVAETLRHEENLPSKIALLRLDTDWYASTLLELEILYPRLRKGGPLLIDDYGYFEGARKAVDEYFGSRRRPFFHLDDEYGRTGTKP